MDGRYECPRCGARASEPGCCHLDGVHRIVAATTPPKSGAQPESDDDGMTPRRFVMVYAPLMLALMVLFEASGLWRASALPLLVLAFLGMRSELRNEQGTIELQRKRAVEAATRPLQIAESIDSVREGFVRVRGRVRALAGAADPDGFGRVLFEPADNLGEGIARGTAFELCDDSGTRAIVRAAYLRLPRECKIGGRYVLAPDTELEITALATWEVGGQEGSTNYRGSARVLELHAPDGEACGVRIVAPSESVTRSRGNMQATSGIRVSVDESETEVESVEREQGAIERARRKQND